MMRSYKIGWISWFLLLSSCVGTLPPEITDDKNDQVTLAFEPHLVQKFESQLRLRRDSEVSRYLQGLAQDLIRSSPDLNGGKGTKAFIVRDVSQKWNCYGLPGNRLYVSAGLLHVVNYENEVAAALAIQLVDIHDKVKRLQIQKDLKPGKQLLGADEILSFADKLEDGVIRKAVGVLYRSGYDSRGMVSLLKLYQTHLAHSPYDQETLERWIGQARQEIAVYAPLRHPRVRTKTFLLIQQRMKQL